MSDEGEQLRIAEAQIRHHLSMLMAHERQLHAMVGRYSRLDSGYFVDLRLALLNCVNEFQRRHPYRETPTQREAMMEQIRG